MKIIISPTKKMKPGVAFDGVRQPVLINKSHEIYNTLKTMSLSELKELYGCSDKIAEENYNTFSNTTLNSALGDAIYSYDGLQFKYMHTGILTEDEIEFLDKRLCILSALYGVVRPKDSVILYRLEMQNPLSVEGFCDLYEFWGRSIYDELTRNDNVIINLASNEYSKVVSRYVSGDVRFITIDFVENVNGKFVSKGTNAKMARGEMVYFIAKNKIESIEGLKGFDSLGYKFNELLSSEDRLVFNK